MTAFSYRAYLEDGSPEAGVIEAVNRRDASRKLAQAKKRPFVLVEAATNKADFAGPKRFWEFTRQGDLTKLLSELSVLLDAGFNVAAALRVVASAESSARQRTRLLAISDQISNGKSLSEAFASLPGLPAEMSAMIASGESSGRIAEVIARMAEASQYRAERRAAITEALIYPAFLVLMVVGAFLFLSLFLMPAIEPIFDSGTIVKPTVVWLLSGFGALLAQHWPAAITLMLAAVALLLLMLRTPSFRLLISKISLGLPVIGRMRRDSAIARYLGTLSLLIGNGVSMIESLRLAALTCSGPEIGEGLETVRTSVSNGERLKSALEKTGIFDGPTLTLVGIGEESNNLPLLLKRAATLVETRLKKAIDRIVTILTPAITIALGLLIGALVVSVMTALLSINEIAVQ